MAARDSALQLLAQGLQPAIVAATIGVEESYISQLMKDEDFAEELESVRLKRTEEDQNYDAKMDRIEDAYLDRINDKMRLADLRQSVSAFRVLNNAKRRRDRSIAHNPIQLGIAIHLQMPASMVPQYVLNQQSEIVEVDGKLMASATPRGVEKLLEDKRAKDPNYQRLQQQEKERAAVTLESVRPVKRKRLENMEISDLI